MESSGSGSDNDASGYESDNNSKHDAPLSDWDDAEPSNSQPKKESETKKKEEPHTRLRLEVDRGALFDSGYHKSPSLTEDSPLVTDPPIPFDFRTNEQRPNKLSNILSVFENFDKVNELDAVRREKKFFNFSTNLPAREVMKKLCQEIARHPVAGPSRDPKKRSPKKTPSSDSEDSTDEVKSIATCILENTLNRIEVNDEVRHHADVIEEFIPELPQDPGVVEERVPEVIVENGDLANNNRDMEGNNYLAENPPIQENLDNIGNIAAVVDNNNEDLVEYVEVAEELPPNEEIEEEPSEDVEVAWSSREALFDANSQVDLLEDFEVNAVLANGIVFPENFIFVPNEVIDEAVLPAEAHGFPHWLLEIFAESEPAFDDDEMHGEPHYYCQGDGLGVHPSTVAINDDDDEDDDEGNESGSDSSSSSSSGSVDFDNVENSTSTHDVYMTPEGSRHEGDLIVVGEAVAIIANPEDLEGPSNRVDNVDDAAEESDSNYILASSVTP